MYITVNGENTKVILNDISVHFCCAPFLDLLGDHYGARVER